MKIQTFRVQIESSKANSIDTFESVQAKTHRGALIECAPYNADDFKQYAVGADGSKWFRTQSGRVAVVTKA